MTKQRFKRLANKMQVKLTTTAILGQRESGKGKELTVTRKKECNETAHLNKGGGWSFSTYQWHQKYQISFSLQTSLPITKDIVERAKWQLEKPFICFSYPSFALRLLWES